MPIPVPPYPSGYRLGSGDAPIQIEVFLDLECPFSKKAWPTVMALVNGDSRDRLSVTALPTILCDHRQSWDLTKALTEVAGTDPLRAWKFISHLYTHQRQFHGDAFDTKTRQDLFRLIEHLVKDFDPNIPAAELVKNISDDSGEVASRAKQPVRYAITRGVWSTPTFVINGSEVPQLESSSTLSDWHEFLATL